MKKFLTGLFFAGVVLSGDLYAKQVAYCKSMFIGPDVDMTCSGDIKGKFTLVQLYHKGWTLKTDISGVDGYFVLIFEK